MEDARSESMRSAQLSPMTALNGWNLAMSIPGRDVSVAGVSPNEPVRSRSGASLGWRCPSNPDPRPTCTSTFHALPWLSHLIAPRWLADATFGDVAPVDARRRTSRARPLEDMVGGWVWLKAGAQVRKLPHLRNNEFFARDCRRHWHRRSARIMAASAPVLATAATAARVPRPRRRVSRRRDPRPVRATTEPNQADVEATRRELERPRLEPKLARASEVATRRAFSDDFPALAANVDPPAEPVRWPLVHARSVEAFARVLANPGTDAQKVMRQALRAQYRPRGSLVYDENDPARWPGSDAPTNAERGAIADAVLASEVNRLRLAYLAHRAAMAPENITVPRFGRAALWAVLCDQEIADACDDDLPPDELSYLDAADAMIAAHWAALDGDAAGDGNRTQPARDACFDAAKLRAIRAVVADPDSIEWPADPATALAARRSVPTWLAAKLIDQHGADVADRVASALLT